MLQSLEVDGFKSFRNFSVELRPGLNVIAGPNGSGKTNLIRFMEFLAHLSSASLAEAVSRLGGAGSIFRQTPEGGIEGRISFKLKGVAEAEPSPRRRGKLEYLYQAQVEFSAEHNAVLFTHQHLKLTSDTILKTKKGKSINKPVFEIEWTVDHDGKPRSKLLRHDKGFADDLRFLSPAANTTPAFEEQTASELSDRSILFLFRYFSEAVRAVAHELMSAQSYNIDPNVVRQSEDIAGQAGIRADGGGLAATLAAAKKAAHYSPPTRYTYFWREGAMFDKGLLAELVSYSKLVNNDIQDIDVKSEPMENRLRVFLRMSYAGGQLELPISLASDGTVKWLALVAAVLTNRSVMSVEEPENFLHPFMQREILNIIRSSCEAQPAPTFAIITTHSETILNSVKPDELLVFFMEDGSTRAIRPTNVEQLQAEMSQTGFGLAFYLLAGAVE